MQFGLVTTFPILAVLPEFLKKLNLSFVLDVPAIIDGVIESAAGLTEVAIQDKKN